MEAYLPRFEFMVDDLARVDGRQLRDRNLTPSVLITLLLLKTAPGNPRIPQLPSTRSRPGQPAP
jgi:hypothetical protein